MGLKVADAPEVMEFFTSPWKNYINKKTDIKEIIQKYNDEGFDASCDLPANAFWQDLYEGMDECKVGLSTK